MNRQECRDLFNRDFPREFQEHLLRGTIGAYPGAWEAVESFTRETAKWLRPYYRHGLMRDTLMNVGRRFDFVNVSVPKTDPPTTDFVQLSSGGSVITIATSIASPKELPRWARHRATRAATLNCDLFEPPTEATGVYALLLCGQDVTSGPVKHAPAFINLSVPASDYDTYFDSWSLYDQFPQVVGEVLGVTPAQIREAYIRMQLRRREEEDAG